MRGTESERDTDGQKARTREGRRKRKKWPRTHHKSPLSVNKNTTNIFSNVRHFIWHIGRLLFYIWRWYLVGILLPHEM